MLTIDTITSIVIVILVLLQQGKGANIGISLGSGLSNTFFGSKGASSFLFRMTVFCTAIFFICCITLGYMSKISSYTYTKDTQKISKQYYDYNQYQSISE